MRGEWGVNVYKMYWWCCFLVRLWLNNEAASEAIKYPYSELEFGPSQLGWCPSPHVGWPWNKGFSCNSVISWVQLFKDHFLSQAQTTGELGRFNSDMPLPTVTQKSAPGHPCWCSAQIIWWCEWLTNQSCTSWTACRLTWAALIHNKHVW